MFEPNDLEGLLLNDHFLGLALAEDGKDAGPRALARWVADIEAGRAQLPPGWRLGREAAGTVIWIAPSGERYRATLPKVPQPGGYADDHEDWLDDEEEEEEDDDGVGTPLP
jgi:hypothetical protein